MTHLIALKKFGHNCHESNIFWVYFMYILFYVQRAQIDQVGKQSSW